MLGRRQPVAAGQLTGSHRAAGAGGHLLEERCGAAGVDLPDHSSTIPITNREVRRRTRRCVRTAPAGSRYGLRVTDALPTTIGVSIPIPSPHGEYLQQRRHDFGDAAAWRIPAHITLLPPTPVDDEVYGAFRAHCAAVAAGAGAVRRAAPRHRHLPPALRRRVHPGRPGRVRLREPRDGTAARPGDAHPRLLLPPARHRRAQRRGAAARPGLRGPRRLRRGLPRHRLQRLRAGPADGRWRPVHDFTLGET